MNDRRHIPCSKPPRSIRGGVIAFAACLLIPVSLLAGEITESFKTRIEGDWAAQEKPLGRRPEQPDAIRAALGRSVQFNPRTEQIVGDSEAARRAVPHYRAPWKFPKKYLS